MSKPDEQVTKVVKTVRSKVAVTKPKRKLTKRPVAVKKDKKVVEPKVVNVKSPLPKVVKPVTHRKINVKPVLAKTTGINISPAKVKNIVSNYVLNKDVYKALKELRGATPKQVFKEDGEGDKKTKVLVETIKGTPVSGLSPETCAYIKHATDSFENNQKEEYLRAKVSKMPPPLAKKYAEARNKAKELHESTHKDSFLHEGEPFDVEAFSRKYDPHFYDTYDSEKKVRDTADKSDEWKKAIDKVTKLKNRFSTNSRIFLSALVEYLIKQLAMNGTVSCVADKKKIIQLSHILDTSKPGFKDRFPLYPLIVNLDTFKQAQAHLNSSEVEKKSDSDADNDADETTTKSEKNTDLFQLDGMSLDKQYQFRYYIGETCREVRMDLSGESSEDKDDEKANEVYNYTSVSKVFKNFCSTLVCEFLIRIGAMLKKEIETRGIKTVNDTVISTVILHYHIVCGVNEGPTVDFIKEAVTKYYSYVSDRQETRKHTKDGPKDVVKPAGPKDVVKPAGPKDVVKPAGPKDVVKPVGDLPYTDK
jgi:hypothetical protein